MLGMERGDGLVRGLAALLLVISPGKGQETVGFDNTTFLDGDSTCSPSSAYGIMPKYVTVDPQGLVVLVLLGLLYAMYAVGYVVEKVMLPAIHVGISQRIDLPDSVRSSSILSLGGCTVPLAFMNIMALTQEPASPTGIGMLLGSAAFNFFVVLPSCYFLSTWEVTPLYWWPLVRDLSFYLLGLVFVVVFLNSFSSDWPASAAEKSAECWSGQEALCCYQSLDQDDKTTMFPIISGVLLWWEGLVLLAIYAAYLTLLNMNYKVKWIVDHLWNSVATIFIPSLSEREETRQQWAKTEQSEHEKRSKEATRKVDHSSKAVPSLKGHQDKLMHILQVVTSNEVEMNPYLHRAGTIITLRFGNSAAEAFSILDLNHKGVLERRDIEIFFKKNQVEIFSHGESVDPIIILDTAASMMQTMHFPSQSSSPTTQRTSRPKEVSREEFNNWYDRVEVKLVREMNVAFDYVDQGNTGLASVEKLGAILEFLGTSPSKKVVRKTREILEIDSKGRIPRSQFDEWYRAAMSWTGTTGISTSTSKAASQMTVHRGGDDESRFEPDKERGGKVDERSIPTPELWETDNESKIVIFFHFLGMPIRAFVIFTTSFWTGPSENLSFVTSMIWLVIGLAWIWFFSWVLLFLSDTTSASLGIPNATMGSTVLAIGMNASNLLYSVVRAINTEVESMRSYSIVRSLEHSIKGNVFDLLFGLPFSLIIASAVKGRPIYLGASNLVSSFGMLLLMVFLTLVLWTSHRWVLNEPVSAAMLILYFLFILQDVLLADWAKPVPSNIGCQGCRNDLFCANI